MVFFFDWQYLTKHPPTRKTILWHLGFDPRRNPHVPQGMCHYIQAFAWGSNGSRWQPSHNWIDVAIEKDAIDVYRSDYHAQWYFLPPTWT